MMGLGGGYLCGHLDDYKLTVVEYSKDVIDQARLESYPLMNACGRFPERASCITADAHTVTQREVGDRYDALIVDVPSCYAQGRDIAVRNGIRLVRSGGAVLCNIWCRDNVKRLLSSLGAKNVRVVRYPVKPGGSSFQYTVVFRKR